MALLTCCLSRYRHVLIIYIRELREHDLGVACTRKMFKKNSWISAITFDSCKKRNTDNVATDLAKFICLANGSGPITFRRLMSTVVVVPHR